MQLSRSVAGRGATAGRARTSFSALSVSSPSSAAVSGGGGLPPAQEALVQARIMQVCLGWGGGGLFRSGGAYMCVSACKCESVCVRACVHVCAHV